MKKKIIIILSFILIITNLNGCLLSKEEQAKERAAIKLGEESVGPYLKEKYGMEEDATAIDVGATMMINPYFFNIPTGYSGSAYAKCEFEGREFEVLVSSSGNCRDDYQRPDIISAVEEHFMNLTEHITCVKYFNNVYANTSITYLGLEKYFDGDLNSFSEATYSIMADIYVLTENNVTTIQEISDNLIEVIENHETYDNYISRYRFNVYYFTYTEETVPKLYILKQEANSCDNDAHTKNLILNISFASGEKPEIKYCHYSINQSRLFS